MLAAACGSSASEAESGTDVDGSIVDSAPSARDAGPERCTSNDDCQEPAKLCDPASGACVACRGDDDCRAGTLCDPVGRSCAPGCSADKLCPSGQTCCGATCHDLTADDAHCNSCDTACVAAAGTATSCVQSTCISTCLEGLADCDGNAANGCEHPLAAGECVCVPGETSNCYDGPDGTVGVGTCRAGVRTCAADGLGWSTCEGQVLPTNEVCANGLDEDCNGAADDSVDADGDGWTRCDGDCCDSIADGCVNPALVNPGAFEVGGNGQDDDCNDATADAAPLAACSTDAKFDGVDPLDAARAIELCQTTTLDPTLPMRRWGVIDAQWLRADGSVPSAVQLSNMRNYQAAILQNYGTSVTPSANGTMLGLSTGRMRDRNDPDFQLPSTSFGSTGAPPAVYLAAHGGHLPSSAGCSGACPSGEGANDSVNLRLVVRVPSNARSFSYALRFFTAEYRQWACTRYNDFFLALLATNAPGIPADRNLSFDSRGNPLSVNNGFFETCVPRGCYTCQHGAGDLAGTGMEHDNNGGGTKWLTTTSPVVPGETMTLDFMIFDVSDDLIDSIALLDNFRWSTLPTNVITE